MAEAQPVGIREALRRVVVGFRGAAALWVVALTVVALVAPSGAGDWRVLVPAAGAACCWAGLTVALAQRRSAAIAAIPFVVADAVVAAALVVVSITAGADPQIYGAYPFSAVLLAAYVRGYPGGLAVAAALTATTVALSSVAGAVTSTFVYLAGAGVAAWSMQVLRRADDRQQRLAAQLADERTQRARADERAEAASALHDSVLQTLALVQRRRADPHEVAALARRGERELRRWMVGTPSDATTFAGAVEEAASEIEQVHAIAVSVVTVGDRPLDDATRALVAAAREALTNVAKHAGTSTASVYAEAAEDEILLTVRDRGRGFDPATVGTDRHGLAASITQRVQRAGGRVTISSRPGGGTEVELVLPLPRQAAPSQGGP